MPKRPRAHQLEDLSINRLSSIFVKQGWTVEELNKDYGEDLLVRIFIDGLATELTFFVQTKATDNIKKYLSKDKKYILYPIKTDHIEHWDRFWEPVILSVWDANVDITYWECIQSFIGTNHNSLMLKKVNNIKTAVPIDNKLDDEEIKRILARTKSRFKRFQREKEGAEILMDILDKQFGIKIEYDPQSGIIILPEGKFIKDSEDGVQFFLFGNMAALMKKIEDKYGISSEQILHGGVDLMKQIVDAYSKRYKLVMCDKYGTEVKSWKTFKQLKQYIDREFED